MAKIVINGESVDIVGYGGVTEEQVQEIVDSAIGNINAILDAING